VFANRPGRNEESPRRNEKPRGSIPSKHIARSCKEQLEIKSQPSISNGAQRRVLKLPSPIISSLNHMITSLRVAGCWISLENTNFCNAVIITFSMFAWWIDKTKALIPCALSLTCWFLNPKLRWVDWIWWS
jgi:hypothetical protein